MRASEVVSHVKGSFLAGPDTDILHITDDTRNLHPGSAFIALRGSVTDGHKYILSAIENGASVIVCSEAFDYTCLSGTFIVVPDTRVALKTILPLIFPSARKVRVAGITGTSGKTTTTYLIESIIRASNFNPGVIGTIEIRYADRTIPSNLTTPGPVELFSILNDMGEKHVDICAMEVSSHALDQGRVDGLTFDSGAFLNLSHEHLDYHGDMESYYQSKRKLFTCHLKGKAVINSDDEAGRRLASEIKDPLTFGFSPGADLRPVDIESTDSVMALRLYTPLGEINLTSALTGRFQVYNIMAAAGTAIALGMGKDSIAQGISRLACVPGRMEAVANNLNLKILVDYAHKPQALENALDAARKISHGKLITIFGCGGDRDKAKRPLMAAVAEKYSDTVIVTSDNPRTEDPDKIIKEIVSGFSNDFSPVVEPDRKKAIILGISMMKKEDLLVIAGKGHEDYQIIGKNKLPFDDRLVVKNAVLEAVK